MELGEKRELASATKNLTNGGFRIPNSEKMIDATPLERWRSPRLQSLPIGPRAVTTDSSLMFLKNGLREDEVVMRMSGCANGCSRPCLGEISFVGKAPGSYLMLLGGGHAGQRLSKIFRDGIGEKEILEILDPLIARYAKERVTGEPFGEWVIRAGVIAPTLTGASFCEYRFPFSLAELLLTIHPTFLLTDDNVNTDGFSPIPAPSVVPMATAA